jgi:general secretion pathway protein G
MWTPRTSRQIVLASLIAIGIGFAIAGVFYLRFSIRRSREVELKKDLSLLRTSIDKFTFENQAAPQALQDLATKHYVIDVPSDPFTGKKDWLVSRDNTVLSPDQTVVGITDVHSASNRVGSDGSPYNQW